MHNKLEPECRKGEEVINFQKEENVGKLFDELIKLLESDDLEDDDVNDILEIILGELERGKDYVIYDKNDMPKLRMVLVRKKQDVGNEDEDKDTDANGSSRLEPGKDYVIYDKNDMPELRIALLRKNLLKEKWNAGYSDENKDMKELDDVLGISDGLEPEEDYEMYNKNDMPELSILNLNNKGGEYHEKRTYALESFCRARTYQKRV